MEQIKALIVPSGRKAEFITVQIAGVLNLQTLTQVEKAMDSLDGICRGKTVFFDLTETTFIGSIGWSLFLTAYKRLRDQGSALALVGMKPEVMNIYEILDFDRIIPHYPDFATAERNSSARRIA